MALEDPRPSAIDLALTARYGADRPDRILWNETIARLLDHRTVRAYRSDPVPEGLVETLVAAGQSAASSSNLQLWSVVAVVDADKRRQLSDLAGGQKHIAQAPLMLLWVADLARAKLVADDAGQPAEGFEFLESFTVAALDAALAAQNAVIAAESLGLGTVYIGALRNRPAEVAAVAGLPPRAAVVFGLVIGWPDDDAAAAAIKPRLPQAAVLHREVYQLEAQRGSISAYDATSRGFQIANGQEPLGWRALLIIRGRSGASLNGRDRLKQVLRTLGFALR